MESLAVVARDKPLPSGIMNITIKGSSKPERVVADYLIKNHISFKFREVIEGREVDFIIGRVIIEVDGVHHRQSRDQSKNEMLARLGYVPLHFSAKEIKNNAQQVFREIKKLIEANN